MKKKIVAIFVCLSVLLSSFAIFAVADSAILDGVLTDYPFPTDSVLSSAIGNRKYIIYYNIDHWRLLVLKDNVDVWLKSKNDTDSLPWFALSNHSNPMPNNFSDNGLLYSSGTSATDMFFKYYRFYPSTSTSWEIQSIGNVSFWLPSDGVVYTNLDLYLIPHVGSTRFTSGVFFSKTPLTQTILHMVLAEIASLIPFLLALVIGFLAFWKGWRFLLTQLRRG